MRCETLPVLDTASAQHTFLALIGVAAKLDG